MNEQYMEQRKVTDSEVLDLKLKLESAMNTNSELENKCKSLHDKNTILNSRLCAKNFEFDGRS